MNGDQGRVAIVTVPTFTPHGGPANGLSEVHGRTLERRPLTSHLELGALQTAPASARAHTRTVLAEWGLGDLADVSELLVSELVTNALYASRALVQPLPSSIHLWVRANRLGIVVTVWDANPQPPVLKNAGVDAEGGRGLQIVAALSVASGWYDPESIGGKCVWCKIVRQPSCR